MGKGGKGAAPAPHFFRIRFGTEKGFEQIKESQSDPDDISVCLFIDHEYFFFSVW
jgi:hypothetical protein